MMRPIYDIERSYAENAAEGPFFEGELPKRVWPPKERWFDFLGTPIASQLGVAAGPLLNSRWVGLAAQLGYDLLTYKTIRSHASAGHPLPNMLYVETEGPLRPDQFDSTLLTAKEQPADLESLAVTNSFGMPSKSPDFLREDIPRAYSLLSEGQALIISIVGTPGRGDFLTDFLETAQIAKEAGATHIEANFSCPNVTSGEGELYTSPKEFFRFAKALVDAIAPIPLIVKMGALLDPLLLKEIAVGAARAGVRALAGINTVRMQVVNRQGGAALGQGRLYSGVCGAPIRAVGLEFIRLAHEVIQSERLDLTLIGVGGIVRPEEVDLYLEAGADFAQTATGMIWDPYLATRYHHLRSSRCSERN